ncbi:MAG: LLM class flavin-dependent oxidoreductase, partial [Lewinella sp.]|nr:LLM class flavin-dependent oxidoreductase [Lewinella sp.]
MAAANYGRMVDFGLRVHVIVRETEAAARAAARMLMSDLDEQLGQDLRNRAQDAQSYGVARQAEMRGLSDQEGYVEDFLWTGIGRARSGCGAAIVGNPDQVRDKLLRYHALGIRAFILSGYPHRDECELFARYVLPQLPSCSLPHTLGRVPALPPLTPLANGLRR